MTKVEITFYVTEKNYSQYEDIVDTFVEDMDTLNIKTRITETKATNFDKL